MAYKRYKVRKGDTFASLGDPQVLMRLNPGVPRLSTGQTIRVPLTKGGPAGYYSTGPGEYKNDLTIGGNRVRMAPNTTITPAGPPQTFFQKLIGGVNTLFKGSNEVIAPSGTTGVQGSVQPGGGGKNARVAQQGINWGQAGAGANPVVFDEKPTRDMASLYARQYGPQPEAPYQIGGGAPNRFNQIPPIPSAQILSQYSDYGIPDTVRNTLAQNWQGSLTLDMASRLYPNLTNAELVSRLQNSGATFNMKTNAWDFPAGLSGGTSSNPNAPVEGKMSQDQQSALYNEYKNERTGSSGIKGTARYGQESFYRNGRLVTRDTRNIRGGGGGAVKKQKPVHNMGQDNSLVTWRV